MGKANEVFRGAGKVGRMGNSRCIPLSAYFAKLFGGVKFGDPITFWEIDGDFVIRFPATDGSIKPDNAPF